MSCNCAPKNGEKDQTAGCGGKTGSFRFRREEHLKGRNEIKEVFGKGRRYSCYSAKGAAKGGAAKGAGAKLFVLKNKLPYNRICFTFPRGFGNAVERNRSKRLSREAFRLLKPRLCERVSEAAAAYDLILLIYPETENVSKAKVTLADRVKQIEFLFTKAGLLT